MSTECSQSLLSRLPLEILVLSLTLCGAKSLTACSATCRWLRHIILNTPEISYLIELDVRGYMDNPSSRLSTTQKIAELRRWDRQWSKLEFASDTGTYITCLDERFLFDFNAGIYAYTTYLLPLPFDTQFHFHFLDVSAPHMLEMLTIIEGKECGRSWSAHAEGQLLDFFIDVGQDVLFFVLKVEQAHTIHIRVLSTGQERNTPITVLVHEEEPTGCFFDVRRHLLLFGLVPSSSNNRHHPLTDSHVINWHTGEIVSRLRGMHTCEAAFLDDTKIVTICRHEMQPLVGLHGGMKTEASLRVYEFKEDGHSTQPLLQCSLLLPPFNPHESFIFKLSTGSTSVTKPDDRLPFLTSPSAPFLVVVAITSNAEFYTFNGTVRICMVSDSLVALCNKMVPILSLSEGESIESTPWEEWGPSLTRCTQSSAWYTSDRDVHGLRMPCESPLSADTVDEITGVIMTARAEDYKIVLFDFNQTAIERELINKGSEGTEWRYVDYETTLQIDCFKDLIVTRLPFRFALSDQTVLMGGIIFDGVHMVLEEETVSLASMER
ncbi:hypothetical protein FRB94_009086 [Tulasnella sp. JGI-2019a]|nr:hypothetical protein FRB94_009086 [Tulasnella sp. JGI-2019a]